MDLLPQSHTEFTSPQYWDSFFKKRGQKAFEWYGEYNNLCGVLHKYVKPADKVLMVGCGNSRLSEDMYDVGYHNIINIDISDIVIRHMTERNAKKREEMSFVKMDVTQMTYEEGTFSVAIDKGTLDALAVDQEEGTLATVNAMFSEVSRVLRLGGRYVIISLLQEQVIQALVKHFAESCWPIRIHRVDSEKTERVEGEEEDFSLPVFAVVITKFKAMLNMKQIVEVCSGEASPQRLSGVEQLLTTVKEMQYYGLVRQRLARREPQAEQLQISLYSHLASCARYTLWVVDSEKRCANKFAIFIVPQGRETEWMFSTDAGRRTLSGSAGFERLVVVALSREHEYQDLEAIKAELSSKVMELAPPTYRQGVQVPFLSIGEGIGRRTVRHRGRTELSGDYVVEDAEGEEGHLFRRLIFVTSQNVVRSEVRLLTTSSEKKKKKKGGKKTEGGVQIDQSYLAFGHHHSMVAGLAFLLPQVTQPRVVLVGLGGGPLAAFLSRHFPQVHLEVVEIDEEMLKVASEWFGFQHNDSLTLHITDGLQFITQLAQKGEKRDVVMFNIHSKDASQGLSCPPPDYLTSEVLSTTADVLDEGGVLVLNLMCRDEASQKGIMDRISTVFPCVLCADIPQEVNKVVYAYKSAQHGASSNSVETSDTAKKSDSEGKSDVEGKTDIKGKSDLEGRSQTVEKPGRELFEVLNQSARRLDRQIRSVSASCDVDLAECIADLEMLHV